MDKAVNIINHVVDGRYKGVITDKRKVSKLIDKFHNEVVRQMLVGNRVVLPGNIETKVVRHATEMKTARIGFAYKLVFRIEKKHKYKVKFTIAPSLKAKLDYIIKNTDFEYRAVTYGYK